MPEPTEVTFGWCCSRPGMKVPAKRTFVPRTAGVSRASSLTMAVVIQDRPWPVLRREGWRCERVSIHPFGSGAANA